MLAFTRERLVGHLLEVSGVANLYSVHDPAFVDRTLSWLEAVEQSLLRLRSPLVSLVAAQRTSVVAVRDGLREPRVAVKSSVRKAMRAAASLALSCTEEALRQSVHDIDEKLDQARDKLAQLLAVATAEKPIPLPPTEPRGIWLEQVWQQLNVNRSTHGMHAYLSGRFSRSDRLYLLDEILQNVLAAPNGDEARPGALPKSDRRKAKGPPKRQVVSGR